MGAYVLGAANPASSEVIDTAEDLRCSRGQTSVRVGTVQGLLNFFGAKIAQDNIFGPETQGAVSAFQLANSDKLSVSGTVDTATSTALQSGDSRNIGQRPPSGSSAVGSGGSSVAIALGLAAAGFVVYKKMQKK